MNFSFNFAPEEGQAMSTSAPTDCAVQALAPAAVPDSTTVVACPFNPDSAIIKKGAFLEDIYEGVRIARVVAPLADTDRVDLTHDLIPGQYEGGLKIWECSIDLVNHFLRRTELHSGSVLELGCGHGLPAVASLLKGCRPVVLSDFNEDVCGCLIVVDIFPSLIAYLFMLVIGAFWSNLA